MKKRETIAFNFDDIVKALNNVGIEVFPGKGKKDYIIAFDEDGNKHMLGKDFNIFDNIEEELTMGFWADYDETVAKLKRGESLSERELDTLVWNGIRVDEIEGDIGRWAQHVSTIIDIDGELWEIDWERGLTEYQEDEFWEQPYRVKKIEKEVTRIEVSYEKI